MGSRGQVKGSRRQEKVSKILEKGFSPLIGSERRGLDARRGSLGPREEVKGQG